jgi:hypothetical protein
MKKYRMDCPAGSYTANNYFALGWAILSHRLWHFFQGHGFVD